MHVTGRPRLLFLCQTLPYPPDVGVNIRTYNVLKLLSETYDITALFFFRKASHPTAGHVSAAVRELSKYAAVEAFAIPHETDRVRLLRDHATSALTRRPYTVYTYESRAFRDRLREHLAGTVFDLVHVDSLDLSGYLPLLDRQAVICVHHNVESQLLRRRSRSEESRLMRAYFSMQASLTEREERRWCPRMALNVTVSEGDRRDFERIAPGARFVIVPNGVDTHSFVPDRGHERGIVFVGGYDWYPNRDALQYFTTSILPHIRQKMPGIPVTWVGRAPDDVRAAYASEHDVTLTGYVDDIRHAVNSARCYIVPLRVGGGTRLKILDAWALGKAIVSTSVGCEGLDARNGSNILIRDDAEQFANAVMSVIEDDSLRDSLGREGRETAEKVYDWQVIGAAMLSEYERVLQRRIITA